MKRHEWGGGATPTRLENWRHEAEWHAGQFCSGQRLSDHHYFTEVWSMNATDVRSSKANYILLRCYLPSFSCIWFEHRLSDRFMHWHKHPLKHILSTHLLFMYRIKRQTVSQSGERHFVRRDWMCSNVDKKSLGCKKPVGRTLLPTQAEGNGKFHIARPDRIVVSLTSELLKNYWPAVRNLRRLGFFWSQSFFCTFSWFFWIFWWTTFNVVRKFPRNRTRNVNASINTWRQKKGFNYKTSGDTYLN